MYYSDQLADMEYNEICDKEEKLVSKNVLIDAKQLQY